MKIGIGGTKERERVLVFGDGLFVASDVADFVAIKGKTREYFASEFFFLGAKHVHCLLERSCEPVYGGKVVVFSWFVGEIVKADEETVHLLNELHEVTGLVFGPNLNRRLFSKSPGTNANAKGQSLTK